MAPGPDRTATTTVRTAGIARGMVLAERYEITDAGDRGPDGAVYDALDRRLRRTVAVHPMGDAADGATAELLAQATVRSRLRHASMGDVFDVVEHDGRLFAIAEPRSTKVTADEDPTQVLAPRLQAAEPAPALEPAPAGRRPRRRGLLVGAAAACGVLAALVALAFGSGDGSAPGQPGSSTTSPPPTTVASTTTSPAPTTSRTPTTTRAPEATPPSTAAPSERRGPNADGPVPGDRKGPRAADDAEDDDDSNTRRGKGRGRDGG